MSKPAPKEIDDGLFLYSTRNDDPPAFCFEVEVAKFNRVDFTIDFTGSVNFELESGGLVAETPINPYSRKRVAYLKVQDPYQAWKLSCRYAWTTKTPDDDIVDAVIERDEDAIAAHVDAVRALRLDSSLSQADLSAACLAAGTTFIDLRFPPTVSSLYADPASPTDDTKVTWRRPEKFLSEEASIFAGEVEPADIRQGALGDCWFMCALSSLAEFPALVRALFTIPGEGEMETSEGGVYKLRLCKGGAWQTVTIDDYFPTFPEGGPVYSRAHGAELWVLLVEKAYAKLHHGYSQLRGGWAYEGLMDLTGAPADYIRLEDEDIAADVDSGALWRRLARADANGYLISASTPGEDIYTEGGGAPGDDGPDSGLVPGHAYTVLQVKETSRGDRLLQVRNPWGSFEWSGDWSDGSELWTEDIKAELGVEIDPTDGCFWMAWPDFATHFNSINICRVRHGDMTPWSEVRRRGTFSYTDAAVSATLFTLEVRESTEVTLTVHQKDERVLGALPYIDIGVTIMRATGDGGYELVAASGCTVDRQNASVVLLDAGSYIVVPTTTGCKLAATRGRAGLRVQLVDDEGHFTYACESALRDMFASLDSDLDGVLNAAELDSFMRLVEGFPIDDEVLSWLLETFDSTDGALTELGFLQCYSHMLQMSGNDPERLWADLRKFGYDASLQRTSARDFIISIHSDTAVELAPMPFSEFVYEEAMEQPVKLGKASEQDGGRLVIYTLKSGYRGVSLAVENRGDSSLDITIDCSKSVNCISHRGELLAGATIEPGETTILHHLMPDKQAAWSWGYGASWSFA
eukprot:PLAT3679.10.p1 GENE.PLAT3679.10~~PLAT3679.10.p1  ORF type:complete len:805 (+),score=398.15 PLAT3679.10:58-2472(+)